MDELKRIVRLVEQDLVKWANEPLTHETTVVQPNEEELCVESTVTPQITGAEVSSGGVHYQQCGGGRRVIRKSHGY